MRNDYIEGVETDLKLLAESFRVSRIFLTAIELGIFEFIDHQAYSVTRISSELDTDKQATQILLHALASMKLLIETEGLYSNAPVICRFLDKESAGSQLAGFRHLNNGWERWSTLTDVVKTGPPDNFSWSDKMRQDLAGTMRLGTENLAKQLCLMIDFDDIKSICDMGCGPGTLTLELLRRQRQTTALLIDRDDIALDLARQDAFERGLQERVEIEKHDVLTYGIKKQFDMIILSQILCLFSEQEARQLFTNAKKALKPGGTLVLGEMWLKDPGMSPVPESLFTIYLLVSGLKGKLFSLREIREMLSDCGISYERFFPTTSYNIIVGKNEIN